MSASAIAPAPTVARGLAVILFTVFLDLLGFGMIIPILPLHARELHATVPQVGWLLSIYSIMQLVCAPLLGRLSDRVGRRPVLLLSIFGSAASQLGYALSPSFPWLLLSRALAGACGANVSAAQAYVADVTDAQSRAGAMGLLGAALGLGFVLGPFLGGELARVEPRLPFFVASALSGLNWVLALLLLREPVRHEKRMQGSLSREALLRLLSTPPLAGLLGLFLLVTFGFANMEGVFALFCHARFGMDRQHVGRLFALVGVVMALVQGMLVRKLAPRLGERRLVVAGIALMAGGLCTTALSYQVPSLVVGTVLIAAGSGLHTPSLSSLISQAAGEQRGSVLGVSHALGALGRILGPLVGTWTFQLGPAVPYLTATGCMVLSLLVALYHVRQSEPHLT
ncbi:MAG: MFS transporter [Myxococcales bacterium]|nr:MFS transporter [Myxococcota bacterium]MDW8280896.1 MFS transporter [Myxococcales bacterium]